MASAIVRLHRKRVARDGLRKYAIWIDGQRVAEVSRGRTVELVVDPGRHEVRATLDWMGSKPVVLDLSDGASADLECSPTSGNPIFKILDKGSAESWIDLRFAEAPLR